MNNRVENQISLGSRFNQLNRLLLNVDDPQTWQPAIASMDQFLDEIDSILTHKADLVSNSMVDSSRIFSMLLTVIATGTQYRMEQYKPKSPETELARKKIDEFYLPQTGLMRCKAIAIAKKYLKHPIFKSLTKDIQYEIVPLLESMDFRKDPDRFMPFRVIQIGNIYERLYAFRLRTNEQILIGGHGRTGLLREIYDRKYLRFGTSGVRGRWQDDFTERRARQVVQAICDFLNDRNVPDFVGRENLAGKRIVIGYDTRRNADKVANWVTGTCLGNGFLVDINNRDTPTPALAFYETEVLSPDEVAGLIICTASHNPPEWQGIKFNPRLGYPAPTNVTDFIAFRINELQMNDETAGVADIEEAWPREKIRGFDPLDDYVRWIKNNGINNARIPVDFDRIQKFFSDKHVVVDEMHGSGRGYLTRLIGEAGVRYTVLHAERDPELGGQDYANPEEPFNALLKRTVKETGAHLGMGMDTDADRYGIVDKDGVYFRPNQILPLLVRYLGMERKLTGRVIATQTGSPLNEVLAGMIPGNEENKPDPGALPGYVGQVFYKCRIGDISSRALNNAFLVPVGIKYIEEIRRMDGSYNTLKQLPPNWRDRILIGGEESSGLTSRGHITDKDGPWANLLVMDMLAYFGMRPQNPLVTIKEIWDDTVRMDGLWESYGTSNDPSSMAGRSDVDAPLEAKEAFINYFLDLPLHKKSGDIKIAGLEIEYLGGIRYDLVEMQLRDANNNNKHYLRVRASGTEPINRIYIESSDPETGRRLMSEALRQLELATIAEIEKAHSEWRLADMLTQTGLTDDIKTAINKTITKNNWSKSDIQSRLKEMLQILEKRNRKVALKWIGFLSS